jgi:hypothetical protein
VPFSHARNRLSLTCGVFLVLARETAGPVRPVRCLSQVFTGLAGRANIPRNMVGMPRSWLETLEAHKTMGATGMHTTSPNPLSFTSPSKGLY